MFALNTSCVKGKRFKLIPTELSPAIQQSALKLKRMAKVSICGALLVCLATTVVAGIPDKALASSKALDNRNTAQPRHLRSSVDMVTGHPGSFEATEVLSSFYASMKEMVVKTATKLQNRWWWLLRKSSNVEFKRLKLHKMNDRLFESTEVLKWAARVEARYKEPTKVMLSTLTRRFRDDADLAKVLVAGKGIPAAEKLASQLLDGQVQRWKKDGKSIAQVFTLLKLDQAKGKLFENPVSAQWFAFAKLEFPRGAIEPMFSYLTHQFQDEAMLVEALGVGENIAETKPVASQLLDAQLRHWSREWAGKSDAHVFTLLKLDKTKDKLFESLVFSQWVRFMKLLSPDEAIDNIAVVLKVWAGNQLQNVLAAGRETINGQIALELQNYIYPPKQAVENGRHDFGTFNTHVLGEEGFHGLGDFPADVGFHGFGNFDN